MKEKDIVRIMDAQYRHSLETAEARSSGRCCCLSFAVLSPALVAAVLLVIIFFLKLKKPIFHFSEIQLDDSFNLNKASNDGGNNSKLIISAIFVSENPNKLGIRYTSTKLGLMDYNNSIGIVDVPSFYQPPHSVNVSGIVHVIFENMNVSKLVSIYVQNSEFRIIGHIQFQARLFVFPLPKIKISLDCRITKKNNPVTVRKGLSFIKTRKALLLSDFPKIYQKCSVAPYF